MNGELIKVIGSFVALQLKVKLLQNNNVMLRNCLINHEADMVNLSSLSHMSIIHRQIQQGANMAMAPPRKPESVTYLTPLKGLIFGLCL